MTLSLKWKRVLLSLFVVAPLVALAIPETVDSRPECQRAQAWAAARSASLPATLAEVAAFPTVYRHAIFAALPAETKAALWHARLDQVAAGSLTPAQRALVERARSIVTPDIYRTRQVPKDWVARATREFGREAFRRNFKELAEGDGSFDTLDSSLLLLKRRWAALATTWARPECECAYGTDDCGPGWICCPLLCSFTYGCGPFGTYTCDSVCRLTCPY